MLKLAGLHTLDPKQKLSSSHRIISFIFVNKTFQTRSKSIWSFVHSRSKNAPILQYIPKVGSVTTSVCQGTFYLSFYSNSKIVSSLRINIVRTSRQRIKEANKRYIAKNPGCSILFVNSTFRSNKYLYFIINY